jgi:murein DD-endopeptidase MepM/ murein hydrolase activator NlpD
MARLAISALGRLSVVGRCTPAGCRVNPSDERRCGANPARDRSEVADKPAIWRRLRGTQAARTRTVRPVVLLPVWLCAMALGCGDGPRSQPVETATPDPQHEVATTERELVAQVVDEAGRGIPQVRVAIAGTTITGETDAEGTITLRVPITGEHTLALDGPHVHPAEVVWQPDGASRIELARRAGLLARVVIDGAPIAGAEVHVSDGSRPTLATAITGDDGVVRFDALRPGPHELWARHGDRVSPLARIADARDAQIELALAAGDEIRGAVSSDAGLPRTARVTLVPIDVDHALRTATLDDAGRFSIAGVPRGKWRVVAEAPGHVQQHDAVVDSRTGQVTVRLARSGTVAGRVVDGDGEPVANATIVLRAQGRATRSLGIESIRPLRWVHPLAGRRLLPTREFVRFGAPRKGHRPVECGAGHCGVDLGWQRGTIVHAAADGTIARAVTENRGEAGRAIAIDHAGGLRTYYLHLDELRAGIEVGQVVRAGEPIGTVGTTGSTRGPHLHFALTEQRGSRAWYVDPEPMLQHAVVLPTPGSMDPLMRDATAVMVARALDRDVAELEPRAVTTDAQGRFRIAGVPPGSYVAVAVATELAPGTSAGFTVRGGAELADIAIALRPGTIVEGRVAGRDGPISGATIIATSGSGETAQEIASGRTSATGEFTLRALSGTITLAITAPGHGTVERTLALGQGRRHREDFLLATENARLFGQVLAADGVPAEQVTVRVLEGPTRRRATADASGRFDLPVAAGSYLLEVTAADHPVTRVRALVDRFSEIRLEPGGSARCDLRDAHSGAPLAGIRIEAAGPNGRTASAVTDAHGVAVLRALAVGEWSVRARTTGYAPGRQGVTIRPSRIPADVRLDLARGATLEGVVRDRHGRRVAGSRVMIDNASTHSDADGNFRFTDVAPGAHRLVAEHGDARGTLDLQLAAADERRSLTVELAH